jgi:hypothetical protein
MEKTKIGVAQSCADCIFQEIIDAIYTCKFYPNYKKLPFPLGRSPLAKPSFCRIKKIAVYEEPADST